MQRQQADESPVGGTNVATGLRTLRAAGVAGLIFTLLMTAVLLLIREPPPADSGAFAAWFERARGRQSVALYLVPFAGIAFLWFLAAVRRRIGSREDQFFSAVFLGSGLLFTATLFAAGAAASAVAAVMDSQDVTPDPSTVIYGQALARTMFYVFAVKMAAAFMLVTSTIGRRARVLPRWFVVIGTIAAVVMLVSVTFWEPLALVFPVWVGVLSVMLLRLGSEEWART